MTDANLRRLHEIERELIAMARDEADPAQRKLTEDAMQAVARAAFGPIQAVYAPVGDPEFKPDV